MKQRITALSLLAALSVVACMAGAAFAQDNSSQRPMFGHPRPVYTENALPATPLTTWNGSFTFNGKTTNFTMVGTNPASSNVTTTVPLFIIPLKMVFTKGTKTKTFDALNHKLPDGSTVVQQTVASPILQSTIDYVQGGTDIGTTQYIDAFQRGNFWTNVMTNTGYHVVFGTPTVLPEITVNVPSTQGTVGTSSFGPAGLLGIASINWFDAQVPTWIAQNTQITPSSMVVFVTYNTYLSQNSGFSGCCIGGYHNAIGSASSPQTYAHFSFMDQSTTRQVFSSDVSALSHEIGEWIDDPYVNNFLSQPASCAGGLLETGDPLENTSDFGDHIYTVGGYQYHIQDLVFLKYFGQTPSTSVNNWWSFQNFGFTTVCQNGQ